MISALRLVSFIICLLAIPISSWAETATSPVAKTASDKQLQKFVDVKEQEVRRVAKLRHTDVPQIVEDFFKAVHGGEWKQAEQIFEKIRRDHRIYASEAGFLSAGIHDVSDLHDMLTDWPESLSDLYIREALRAVPDGSIVVGGTDAGRFLITYGADTLRNRKVIVITQNALADNRYSSYIRSAFTNEVKLFSTKEAAAGFKEYVDDVKAGRRDAKGSLVFKDGRAQIRGVLAVMGVNGILLRKLVDLNKDSHQFFVEESYAIDWMYPYMTPHGLIMKLNNTTMKTFPAEMVKKDWDYWNALEAKLIDQPDVAGSDTAIKAFSKCRCAIAGLYLKHGMPEQAIAAFQQALRLTPNAPEPNFRLANIYKDRGDYDKAGDIILKYMQHDIPIDQMVKPTQYLKELRHLRNTENKPPPSPATNRD